MKRAFDLFLSFLAVVFLLSWLLPLLGLLIWLDSGGPVFFRQQRIGRHGRRFCCLKLRTMDVHSGEHGGVQQVTRLGCFLRRRKLDEFPQLLNVLWGDMSLVGPRPHMLSDHHRFCRMVGRKYHLRHLVRPGITGLAQIRGFEGPVLSDHKIRGRVRLDLFYIRRWSMHLEGWIIWETTRLLVWGPRDPLSRSSAEPVNVTE